MKLPNAVEYAAEWLNRLRTRPEKRAGRLGRHWGRARSFGRVVDETLNGDDMAAIFAEYGNRCAYCGVGGYLEVDHFYPLSRGGHHVRRNLVPACMRCNRDKGHASPELFLLQRPRADPRLRGLIGPDRCGKEKSPTR